MVPLIISTYIPTTPTSIITLVLIITTPFIVARLIWYCLTIIARRQRILVRRVQRKLVASEHPLELDIKFVQDMEHDRSSGACRVQSIPAYLLSLDYNEDQVSSKTLMSTLVSAFGKSTLLPLTALIPSITPQSPGVLARFSVAEFPSVLILAAVVDAGTQVLAMVANADENVLKQAPLPDSMDLLWMGEPPGVTPTLPRVVRGFNNEPITDVKTYFASLHDAAVIDLGPDPDLKHYHTPKPFSPDLLPGLCIGMGGLTPGTTPYEAVRNRAFAMLCNMLASNGLHWSEFSPRITTAGGLSDQAFYPPTAVTVAGVRVETPGELIDLLIKHGGPKSKFQCHVRTNLTGFGIGLCVLDENVPPPTSSTTTDASYRFNYTQLPVLFCTRTGLTNTENGDPLLQLSAHSSIEWHFIDNEILGPGRTGFTAYTGVEGFSGFHVLGEWERPWVFKSDVRRAFSVAEAIRAVDVAAAQAVAWNVCVRLWKFPMGGYGGLGVCADFVANIESVLKGQTKIFPLMMRSDAKSALISVIHVELVPMLLSSGNVRANAMGRALNAVCDALIGLPNDVQVLPTEMLNALDRYAACTMDSPFAGDMREKKRWFAVKNGWKSVMEYFGKPSSSSSASHQQQWHLQQDATPGDNNNVKKPQPIVKQNSMWRC